MQEHRTAWLTLASILVTLGAGTLVGLPIAAAEYPKTHFPVWPFVLGAGGLLIGLYLFAAIIWHLPLPGGGSIATSQPTAGSIESESPHLVVTIPPHMAFAFMKREVKEWHPHMIELRARGYAAAPATGEPITLLRAKGRVRLDDGEWEEVDAAVGQHWDPRFPAPDDFNYPPVVNPGRTIEIEWSFHVHAPHADGIPGAVIQPNGAEAEAVEIIDQLQRSYQAGDGRIDYGGVMAVDEIPRY